MLIVLTLAWGALTFGAVYPWGYWPLLAMCTLLGAWGVLAPAHGRSIDWPLAIAFAAVLAAILLQLVPLPRAALHAISPATDAFLERMRPAVRDGRLVGAIPDSARINHPLSIDPAATWRGAVFVFALAVFLLGLQRASGPARSSSSWPA